MFSCREEFPLYLRLSLAGKHLSSKGTFPCYLPLGQFSIYNNVTHGFKFGETLPYISRNEKLFPNGILGNKKKYSPLQKISGHAIPLRCNQRKGTHPTIKSLMTKNKSGSGIYRRILSRGDKQSDINNPTSWEKNPK